MIDTTVNRGHHPKNWVMAPTVCEPKFRERTPQETFHLVERKASFSLRLGCGFRELRPVPRQNIIGAKWSAVFNRLVKTALGSCASSKFDAPSSD
jgi:hypothetical protein